MGGRHLEHLRPLGAGALHVISLRRHVLTLVAVFLALAIGVVLGSTSVASSIRDAVVDREETTAARLESAEGELARQRQALDQMDGMAGALGAEVLEGALEDRPVLLVVAPGAHGEDVDAVADTLRYAGAVDAGRITLTDRAVDPAADSEVQSLVSNLPIGEAPAADADLGTQLGTAVGRAALLRTEDAEPHLADEDRATVLTTLADAEVISFESGTIRPGQLVLLVTGPDEDESTAVRLTALSRALGGEGAGAVVAAQLGEPSGHDAVTALRATGEESISTIDNLGSRAGRLATGLALAEQLDRGQGHYGLRPDSDAAVPDTD